MKKILKNLLYSFLAVIVIAIVVLQMSYTGFVPNEKGLVINEADMVYYQESYSDSRNAFLNAARKVANRYDSAEVFSIKVPSMVDPDLSIDFLYLPPIEETGRLMVLSSGIHGVEGFAGSAVQQMFLEELITPAILSETGILLIHGINPYGFKYSRRVTENNVDLNRGSDVDSSLFETKNDGYTTLYNLINPKGKVSSLSLRNQFFHMIAMGKMIRSSMEVMRQAIVQGQYEYPEGLFFGGTDFEPQIDSLRTILPGYFNPYDTILAIDLHTGYGARGELHLFPMPVEDQEIKKMTESVFEGHHIEWGDSDDFYTVSGAFAVNFLSKLNPDATYLYMIFEWGTFDSQKTFGSLQSLQKMINENQGVQYGYKNSKQQQKIEKSSLELYYPHSEAWRSEVIRTGRDMLSLALKTYPKVK